MTDSLTLSGESDVRVLIFDQQLKVGASENPADLFEAAEGLLKTLKRSDTRNLDKSLKTLEQAFQSTLKGFLASQGLELTDRCVSSTLYTTMRIQFGFSTHVRHLMNLVRTAHTDIIGISDRPEWTYRDAHIAATELNEYFFKEYCEGRIPTFV